MLKEKKVVVSQIAEKYQHTAVYILFYEKTYISHFILHLSCNFLGKIPTMLNYCGLV